MIVIKHLKNVTCVCSKATQKRHALTTVLLHVVSSRFQFKV